MLNIEQSTVQKLKITGAKSLDPVSVFLEDQAPGKGKITIECYGKSWSAWWGAMGDKTTITEFFCEAPDEYLAKNLSSAPLDTYEDDYEAMVPLIRKRVLELRREEDISSDGARTLYNIEDWDEYKPDHPYDSWKPPYMLLDKEDFEALEIDCISIPHKPTHEYEYLTRIICAVKAGLQQISQPAAA